MIIDKANLIILYINSWVPGGDFYKHLQFQKKIGSWLKFQI